MATTVRHLPRAGATMSTKVAPRFSAVINSFQFQAIAACLYEFIQRMKAAGIWENTVFQIGSEFTAFGENRCERSDHGWQGNVITAFPAVSRVQS